jgi:Ca2+-binding EF-hand superfamily protein
VPSHYKTAEISEEDVKDIKSIFDYYDSTKTGVLLPVDLIMLLSENGYNADKKTVYEILA